MRNLLKKEEKGFTLIEIVLVLAIAGLILVIVFLAVQGAQRSRRDTQRKSDASRALAAVESCASNNSGLYANCLTNAQLNTAANSYFYQQKSPTGANYAFVVAAPAADAQLWVQAPGACPTAGGTVSVKVWQEAGAAFCVHN